MKLKLPKNTGKSKEMRVISNKNYGKDRWYCYPSWHIITEENWKSFHKTLCGKKWSSNKYEEITDITNYHFELWYMCQKCLTKYLKEGLLRKE